MLKSQYHNALRFARAGDLLKTQRAVPIQAPRDKSGYKSRTSRPLYFQFDREQLLELFCVVSEIKNTKKKKKRFFYISRVFPRAL